MENKYSSIPTVGTILAIKNALEGKYNDLVIHYTDATELIFSCPSISNKVIRIRNYESNRIFAYYGDAWTSGATITNQVQFAGHNSGNISEGHLILADNFILINMLQGTINSLLIIIGKMTNDEYVALGLVGISNYTAFFIGKNTSNNDDIKLITFPLKFGSKSGKLYKQNVLIRNTSGIIQENNDGSIATIDGIYNVSHVTANNLITKFPDYLFTTSSMYMNTADLVMQTCLLVEF